MANSSKSSERRPYATPVVAASEVRLGVYGSYLQDSDGKANCGFQNGPFHRDGGGCGT